DLGKIEHAGALPNCCVESVLDQPCILPGCDCGIVLILVHSTFQSEFVLLVGMHSQNAEEHSGKDHQHDRHLSHQNYVAVAETEIFVCRQSTHQCNGPGGGFWRGFSKDLIHLVGPRNQHQADRITTLSSSILLCGRQTGCV